MSGIYIPNMEMPKACVYRENGHLVTCPLYDIDGYCKALNTEASHRENEKLSNCPLVPVPPHGRLIDADALMKLEVIPSDNWVFRAVEKAPTIIPAEEDE